MGYNAKVVLFNPNPRGFKGQEATFLIPPFALLAVAGPLDKAGYEVKIVDQTTDLDWKNLLKKETKDALCLGVTSMTGYQIKGGIEASKIAKENNPKIKIIWGGYHASILPTQTCENELVDIVVKGQGEKTMLALVKALEKGKELKEIKGVTYKKNSEIVSNKPRFFEGINNFPSFPFHLINIKKYVFQGITSRTIGYITSRGCPCRCGFCAEKQVTKGHWSGYKVKGIMEDLKFLIKEAKIDGLHIFDSNFFVDKKRVQDFCKSLIKEGLSIKWGNINMRVNALKSHENIYKLLYESGCNWVLTGAESGQQEVLDMINKDVKVKDILEFKTNLSKYNIRPFISFILGFPLENRTEEEIKEEFKVSLKLIKKIIEIDDNNTILYWMYTPYPGTDLYQQALKKGFIPPKTLEGWADFSFSFTNLPWVSKKYEKKLDVLNKFIFPYTSYYFKKEYKKLDKNFLKRIFGKYHNILCFMAKLRWKYQFFEFPLEYYLIRLQQKIKN